MQATLAPDATTTLRLPSGATLTVPARAVAAPVTGSIAEASPPAVEPSEAFPARATGPTYALSAGGASLAQPVTISLPFDAATLPDGLTPDDLFLAYRDPATAAWVPVPSTVNVETGTVSAMVSHLSDWSLFGWDWNYWLAVLKGIASLSVSDTWDALTTFASGCKTKAGGFQVDNAPSHIIEGCITKADAKRATIEVRNLRAYAFAVTSPDGTEQLDPGTKASITVSAADPPPAVVTSSLTSDGITSSLIDIGLSLIPGWHELVRNKQAAPILALMLAELKTFGTVDQINKDLKSGKMANAVEKAVRLYADDAFQAAFVAAVQKAGARFGIPLFVKLTPELFKKALAVVSLGDLIVTSWSWVGDYFVSAQTEVSISWKRLPPPVARCPFDTSIGGGSSGPERPIPSAIPRYLPVDLVPAGAKVFVTTLWGDWGDPIWTVGPGMGSCRAYGGNYVEQSTVSPNGKGVGIYLFPGSLGPNQTTSCAYIPAARDAARAFFDGTLGPDDCKAEPGTKVVNIPTGVADFWIAAVMPKTDAARKAMGPALYTFMKADSTGASSSASCAPGTSSRMCLAILAFFVPQSYGGSRVSSTSRAAIDARLADLLGVP